ncbi:MAG: M23 family metallopeptidase [Veillonellales bacterium]
MDFAQGKTRTNYRRKKTILIMIAILAAISLLAVENSREGKNEPTNIADETVVPDSSQEQPVAPANIMSNIIKTHTVTEGETLGTIAAQYNIDVDTLLGANPELSEEIHPGDQLVILPQKGVLHAVDMGDTLWSMANDYGVDMEIIMQANGKTSEDLTIGEKLFVPGAKPAAKKEVMVARAKPQVSRGSANRFSWPVQGEISSPFGYRWGRLHSGIDIANDSGTSIHAAMSGRVTYTGYYSGYGYTLIMEHAQGYETLYGHLSGFAVGSGQYVRAGQVIAYMGSTGNSTGPHLHFEVHQNGRVIDPMNVLP